MTYRHYVKGCNLPIAAAFDLYRKMGLTQAVRIDGPFSVKTREGTIACEDGYLCLDSNGDPYPCAADVFEASYEKAK